MDELQAVPKLFLHATVILPAVIRTCLVASVYVPVFFTNFLK
jgi:hypothetical protein